VEKNRIGMSPIVLGLWRLKDWKLSDERLLKYIEESMEIGVTSFDHADIYGDYSCEKLFGQALALNKSLRKKMQIITKGGICLPSQHFPEHQVHHRK